MEALISNCKVLGKAIARTARRIPLNKLNAQGRKLEKALSTWLPVKALYARWKARGIGARALPPAHLIKKAAFVLACVLFAAGLAFWTRRNILHFERETVTKVNHYMSGVAREKAQCIEQSVQDIQDFLALLARKPFSGEFKTGQPLPYNDYVAGEALLEHVGNRVDSIYRIDKKGTVLHRVPHKKGTIGEDFSNTPGIRYVLENHKPYLSEVFDLYPDHLGVTVSHPVFDEDKFMGVICFMIFLDTLNESACHIQNGSTGSIWVINSEGLIISHPNPDFIGRNILDVERDDPADFNRSDFENIVGKMMTGEEGYGVYHSASYTGEKAETVKRVAAFVPISLSHQTWSIAISMDYGEIADPVKRNARNNFLAATLVMLISGAIGIVYYRNQKKKAELEVIARSAEELRISNEKLRQEIEQRIQAENAREESEGNYRLLAENVMDVIWIADLNLRLVYISPSVKRVLGLDPQEVIGETVETVLTPASLEVARKALAEGFAREGEKQDDTSSARTLDLELYRKDNSTIWAETKVNFLHDSEGALTGLMGVTRDITEKMQLQNQFFQAQKMESIGTLAGGVAHDFNNLISGILGYASLIKMKLKKNHKLYRYADTIETSARHAGELTGQLLAFSRGGNYEPKVVNLNRVLDETLEIINRTFDKSIEIEVNMSESIPTVEADPGQIQQVIMNLCVNACHAMANKGKLIIETTEETIGEEQAASLAKTRPGSYVILSIADTGIGMDEETVKRIFEPFFTTKEKGKGTGLGLAMVYGVVQRHGGTVRVSSEPGKGSTFKIYIPASGKPETEENGKKRIMRGRNEAILVVDDEEIARSLAKDALESCGYRVLLAENGVEAIDIYQENNDSLGLVILDMVMPKMGGRDTFLKLKELNGEVKAILVTGYRRNEEANEIMRNGAKAFIQKPFQLDELLSKVRKVLDNKTVA